MGWLLGGFGIIRYMQGDTRLLHFHATLSADDVLRCNFSAHLQLQVIGDRLYIYQKEKMRDRQLEVTRHLAYSSRVPFRFNGA